MKGPRKSRPVGVLAKTFRILDLLRTAPAPLTLQQISTQSELNKSTALRYLAHLETERYLSRDARGAYSLGPKLLQPVPGWNAQSHLREAARPSLWELWRATQETVNLAVLEGFEVVYVDCLESPHDLRLVTNVGMRAVFYRTALGKAMAAFLPAERRRLLLQSTRFQAFTPTTVTSAAEMANRLDTIRNRGFAMDNEESVPGLRCVGAPVLNAEHEAVAAISVSGPTSRFTPDRIGEFTVALLKAARAASERIAAASPTPE